MEDWQKEKIKTVKFQILCGHNIAANNILDELLNDRTPLQKKFEEWAGDKKIRWSEWAWERSVVLPKYCKFIKWESKDQFLAVDGNDNKCNWKIYDGKNFGDQDGH